MAVGIFLEFNSDFFGTQRDIVYIHKKTLHKSTAYPVLLLHSKLQQMKKTLNKKERLQEAHFAMT